MSILTRSKVTEIFCIADDFYKELEKNAVDFRLSSDSSRPKRNRKCTMSESEIITILICFHMGQFRNFKHYYLSYVSTSLASDFSDLLSYNRFIQIEHRVVIPLLMFIRLIGFGSCTGISFVDSTKIAVCHNKRISTNRVFRGMAEIGKSTMGWFYGFKLHLICNDRGEILNFMITPGDIDDREPLKIKSFVEFIYGKLVGDKGYIGKDLFSKLFIDGIQLITKLKNNMKGGIRSMYDRILLRKRAIIETINDELKNIAQIEHSRHRSFPNFVVNLIGGIAAYCLFPKKPMINLERVYDNQLTLF